MYVALKVRCPENSGIFRGRHAVLPGAAAIFVGRLDRAPARILATPQGEDLIDSIFSKLPV
jgi:hypothetical protein